MKKYLFVFALSFLFTCSLWAQVRVTGKVTNLAGEPLPGVNVIIKGTEQGTITDVDGVYAITGVSTDDILVFSFIGMLTEEIPAGNQTEINMMLVQDIMALDEVVVIGYGTVKRRDLTGAVSSVKAEEIIKSPTSNSIEAIQGKVSGVDIVRSSGKAGAGIDVRIRGNRSFGNPDDPQTFDRLNSPLYIIDGIQGGSIADVNPYDIESIEILKDASTTAIYGWQGANGVILITTKKGSAGRTKVSYNGYYGINGLTPYPKGRLREDYIRFRRDANYGTTWNSEEDDPLIFSTAELEAIQNDHWIDWIDLMLHNGTIQNHQLSVSGGNEKSNSYFSVGYFNEIGTLKDNYTKYNARFNTESTLSKWAKTGLQAQITYYDQNSKKDALAKANSISPLGSAYDENGNINLYPVVADMSVISPLTDTRNNAAVNNQIGTRVFASGFMEFTLFKGLSFRSNLGVNLNFNRTGIFNDSLSLTQYADNLNKASIYSGNSRNMNFDNILTYVKDIAGHSFTITALSSYNEGVSDYVSAEGLGQLQSSFLFHNLAATDQTSRNIYSGFSKSTILSFAGRLNYSFRGKYLLTLTERMDGSSRLAKGHKWAGFPSVAAAWRISDESFMKNLSSVSNLKFRASYGEAGNASIQPYATQSYLTAGGLNVSFNNNPVPVYTFTTNKASSSLEWERSATTNIGIDIGLFSNRVEVIYDNYLTKTTGILMQRYLPISNGGPRETGFRIWQNIGSSENKGYEITINSVNVVTNDFKWTSSFTFSRNKEKITELIDGQDIINSENNSLLLGRPIRSFYNYQKLGIWQISDTAHLKTLKDMLAPGDIKLADLNNDSAFTPSEDKTYIGSTVPDWVCGFQNTFKYKAFDLSILLFARWGQMIKNDLLGRYNPSGTGNGPEYFDYWTPDNPTNDFPQPHAGYNISSYLGYMTLPYVDGSYFKIKNITLGYTLPKTISKRIYIENLRIYATASNILTIAKSHLVKYYDPENRGSEATPMSRQVIFGINVDF